MVNRKVEIDLNEIKRVYKLMEEINDFFHQTLNFNNAEKFGKAKYKEISEIYYHVMWDWLPEDIKKEIIGK